MFERRLKVLLLVLSIVIATLLMCAAWVQILGRHYWRAVAIDTMKRPHYVSPTRGRILDVNGKVLAEDQPCIDACVDYRAHHRSAG